jgi:hypothetical protein
MFSTGLVNEEFEIAQLLIENGADVNERTNDIGETALMISCRKCHSNIAKLLIETPNINLGITDNNGFTALDYAHQYCGERITDLFPMADFEHVSVSKSEIPEEVWNTIAYGNENVEEFLAEDVKNKIFKFNTTYFPVGGEGVEQHYLSGTNKIQNTFYPCFSVGTSLRPRDENVDKTKPLFLLSNVGPIADFVLMTEFIKALKSDEQYFEIITKDAEDIPTITSAQMLGPNPDAVSANHCQGGKAAKIFKLAIIDIVEEAGNTENSSSASSSSNNNTENSSSASSSIMRIASRPTEIEEGEIVDQVNNNTEPNTDSIGVKTRKGRKGRKGRKTRKTRKTRKGRKGRKTKRMTKKK